MKPRKLIIGYGNPLRGDDGVGWKAASTLAATIPSEAARILTVHQLTPELAEPVSQAELVIFIDASALGRPGTWKCEEVKSQSSCANSLAHSFDASALLAYSRAIFNATPRALLISVVGESFAIQDYLTQTVEALLPEVVNDIRRKVLVDGTRCRVPMAR
jgi:hydrogenase maturation protease